MSNTEEIIRKFRNLNIHQQQLIDDLINEINNTNKEATVNTNTRSSANGDREPNYNFISSNGVALAVSDRVRLLNTRKTGRIGDFATVTKFGKKYVAVELERNGSYTQRASKYLVYES